jgi:hypothetical protein
MMHIQYVRVGARVCVRVYTSMLSMLALVHACIYTYCFKQGTQFVLLIPHRNYILHVVHIQHAHKPNCY